MKNDDKMDTIVLSYQLFRLGFSPLTGNRNQETGTEQYQIQL